MLATSCLIPYHAPISKLSQLLLSELCVYLLPTIGPLHMLPRITTEGWKFSDVLSSHGPVGSRQGLC